MAVRLPLVAWDGSQNVASCREYVALLKSNVRIVSIGANLFFGGLL